jgi:Zn-dependent peptidase ImmA (M78 family)/transcriptional regulator with XRE-family HTH domain
MANLANITPEIIPWARKQHKLDIEKLADLVGVHVNQIEKWESGAAKPTFTQAQEMASHLHIPLGYLFLSAPPNLELPLPDLRTRKGKKPKTLSASFQEVLYGALDRQDWYREYIQEYKSEPRNFVGRYTTENPVLEVAEDIRKTLVLTPDLRDTAKTLSKFLELLSAQAEAVGILVMRSGVVGNNQGRALDPEEFQGFVITDPVAPLIFINSVDFVTARIFTMAHELAHIWIGKSGILNPAEDTEPQHTSNVEEFCNAVAAEVLVPSSEFLSRWPIEEGSIQALSRYFKVSGMVIVRRAHELDQIDDKQFAQLARIERSKRSLAKRKGGSSDYYENVGRRHSFTLMDSIIHDVRSGGTFLRDGAALLDMRLPTFTRMVESGEF